MCQEFDSPRWHNLIIFMNNSIKIIIFVLITSISNVILTSSICAVFLFLFLSFIASSLDSLIIDYAIVFIVFLSIFLDYILYKLIMSFISKKIDLSFLKPGFIKPQNQDTENNQDSKSE